MVLLDRKAEKNINWEHKNFWNSLCSWFDNDTFSFTLSYKVNMKFLLQIIAICLYHLSPPSLQLGHVQATRRVRGLSSPESSSAPQSPTGGGEEATGAVLGGITTCQRLSPPSCVTWVPALPVHLGIDQIYASLIKWKEDYMFLCVTSIYC